MLSNVDHAVEVNAMSSDKKQSDLEIIGKDYLESSLCGKQKSESKIHYEHDRNQYYKKGIAPESAAKINSPAPNISLNENMTSTLELLDQRNNGSNLELSLELDLDICEESESPSTMASDSIIPETTYSPSPIIGALQNMGRSRAVSGPNNKVHEDQEIQTVIETQESESFTMLENGNNLVENAQINNLTLPVTNNTLRSQGYGTVIIIKPTADNVKDLINNPVEIIKATKNSLFNCPEIKDIRVNKRKNILVAEMKESNSAKLKYLLEVEMLGTWAVKCYQPNSDLFHHGVISPVAPNA